MRIPEACDCNGSLTSAIAAATASLPGTAIATATNLTLSAIVVGDVRPMKTMMAFATLRFKAVQMNWRATTTHRQHLTMVLAQSMMSVAFVAEMASLLATVIAMATNSTPLVSVAGLVWLMRMPTASATTLTRV